VDDLKKKLELLKAKPQTRAPVNGVAQFAEEGLTKCQGKRSSLAEMSWLR
jgi:hypothetical protein